MSLGLQEGNLFADRYRVLGRLGSGGNGTVYEAVHVETARRRALKVLHSHKLEQPEARERFRHEARVTAHIASEHVVEVIDAGVDDATGTPFLVMELLQGEDLGQRLRREGRLPPEEALHYLHHTALALGETHRASIVHRDLKPGNLFLVERPGLKPLVKVLDFGAAKIVADSLASGETAALGTLLYMAPEQIRRRSLSKATDIYALGMTAYTLLTGEAYWADEKRENGDPIAFAMIAARGPRELASARAARSGVALPPALDAWFARATALQPSGRFASAMEAVHALADVFGLPRPASAPPSKAPGRTSARSEQALSTHEHPERRGDRGTNKSDGSMGDDERPPSRRGSATLSETLPSSVHRGNWQSLPRDEEAQDHEVFRAGPQARRRRPARATALNGMVLAALGAVFPDHRVDAPVLPPRAESVLLSPSSKLACPIFEASIVEESAVEKPAVEQSAGWLGAAAATMVCERARVIRGGARDHMLIPAELLDLADEPEERLPADPYGGSDARQKSLAKARERAAAYIDGHVIKEATDFRVSLALHKPDRSVLAQGEGKGHALYQAVREAMRPLLASNLIPQALALDPEVAQWSPAPDIDTALALQDLTFALSQSGGDLAKECARVDEMRDDLGVVGSAAEWLCAHAQGRRPPDVPLPPIDPEFHPAYVMHARLAGWLGGENANADLNNLELLRKQQDERSLGHDVVTGIEACLLPSPAPEAVRKRIYLASQVDPTRPLGELCVLWPELMAHTLDTSSAQTLARVLQLWAPWSAGAWNAEPWSQYVQRAHILSPLDTNAALTMARLLFSQSALEKERELTAGLAASGEPVHRLVGDLVVVEVDAAEAHFSVALDRALRAMKPSDEDAYWVRALRFEAAWRAVEIGWVLRRSQAIADEVIKGFIVPEPAPLDGSDSELPARLVTLCVLASKEMSRTCAIRFRALRSQLSGGIPADTDALDKGLDHFTRGDRREAIKVWRPLLGKTGVFGPMMLDALATTLERDGEVELMARLKSFADSSTKRFGGMSPIVVRPDRRAHAQGDL